MKSKNKFSQMLRVLYSFGSMTNSSKKGITLYMNTNNYYASNFNSPDQSGKKMTTTEITNPEVATASHELIRFEEKKERYVWAYPNEIIFVKSADHYVKSLIKCGAQKKWVSRHCTIKELLGLLPFSNFLRLNKFYLLNRNHFSHINEK